MSGARNFIHANLIGKCFFSSVKSTCYRTFYNPIQSPASSHPLNGLPPRSSSSPAINQSPLPQTHTSHKHTQKTTERSSCKFHNPATLHDECNSPHALCNSPYPDGATYACDDHKLDRSPTLRTMKLRLIRATHMRYTSSFHDPP